MSRFVINRRFLVTAGLVFSLTGSVAAIMPQASYADSWADLLKPLVKNVIVPGASMGMKKLMERSEKKHGGTATDTSAQTPAAGADAGSATPSVTDSAFSTPEEPMRSSEGFATSTPEEPISTVANSVTSALEPPPPPPPPVATP